MTHALEKGRKRYALDLWVEGPPNCDPEVTYYSASMERLLARADSLIRQGDYAIAQLYERTEKTPSWDKVESGYWNLLREIPAKK